MKQNKQVRILAAILCAALTLSCLALVQPQAARAAENGPQVYQACDKTSFEQLIDAKKAPVKDGYIFAGWVAKNGDEAVAITSKEDAVLSEEGVTITAKFIPAHLTGVSCQVKADIQNEGVEKTDLRIVSLVDNGEYQAVGFNLYRRLGTTEQLLCSYKADGSNPAQSEKRYEGLRVYNAEGKQTGVKSPADIFGSDAEDFYFTTVKINNIPKSAYENYIIIIKPYWITADGTYVEGVGEYNRVSDGIKGIVNVSVNLKQAQAIAAGMMKVSYQANSFTYLGFDAGRVFGEMQAEAQDGTVSCVGNVADMNNNSANANDIYINLRFQATNVTSNSGYDFTIDAVDFANKDEKTATVDVPPVKYWSPNNG